MGWLAGWDQRIKLTVDKTKIDATLSHFPVAVVLSPTHGNCVFDELTTDANRFKIAFTKSDGTTEMYAEIEKWEDANERAIIHVSISGWSIASGADTNFYMYYDIDHADNTTYIGDIDSTPGHSVWDSNFKFVCHMVDATTSSVKDSTSNGHDGTKKGANEPIEYTGILGRGQDFDGADDDISLWQYGGGDGAHTIEAAFKAEGWGQSSYGRIVSAVGSDAAHSSHDLYVNGNAGHEQLSGTFYGALGGAGGLASAVSSISLGSWYHGAVVMHATDSHELFVDGTSVDTSVTDTGNLNACDSTTKIGNRPDNIREFEGVLDEIRISNIGRSAAWIKATYNSLWDTLLTYGAEETSDFTPRIIMF